jgi:hypothetical protein
MRYALLLHYPERAGEELDPEVLAASAVRCLGPRRDPADRDALRERRLANLTGRMKDIFCAARGSQRNPTSTLLVGGD